MESGLDYFGARYYSGAMGRFTSPDGPLLDQTSEDPQSWNLYGYVRNNPLAFVDPTGQYIDRASFESQLEELRKKQAEVNAELIRQMVGAMISVKSFADKTQQFMQPASDFMNQYGADFCAGGYIALGASVGAYGGVGVAGFSGGATAVVTVPGGALIGGAAFGYGAQVLCSKGSGGGGNTGSGGFKNSKPRLSGKEAASDVPTWAKGQRPLTGEAGKKFAERLLDGKYGPGNYPKGPGSEFNKIQKWGDRAFE